ncbi:MAG: phosphoenolpyruvate--protein phosphotransferase [Butyrivibrio sp.]|nr:phosphoenolpyruvate--protein phosphotransferase [Acetatifactor muris]MCM1559033.1 phosphoenolpyruvate--protein phosphotransferase [Butyrivibrio sp.]
MQIFQGKGVYAGVAVGRITLFRKKSPAVQCVHTTETEREKARFRQAEAQAARQLEELYRKTCREAGEGSGAIFRAQQMMLEDEDYNASVYHIIESRQVNAEYAVSAAADHFAEMFSAMEDAYMRDRAADVRDISERLAGNLRGMDSPGMDSAGTDSAGTDSGGTDSPGTDSGGTDSPGMDSRGERILCASDLTPSETASLDRDRILAIVTERGSVSSHTAILAREMNIPAVVAVGSGFQEKIREGDEAIVDGGTGEIFVNPDEETRTRLLERQRAYRQESRLLEKLKGRENRTVDGRKTEVYANIGGVGDVSLALENDAGGIGLFRSEFLYMESSDYPTEEQQLAAYRRVLEAMGGRRVIIRTLDIGADKKADYFHLKEEENPALGLRAIRICLTRPEIFKTQLRALYRASVYGNLSILFPMITSVIELERILKLCAEVRRELNEKGIAYSENVKLGVMIETPAAALISHRLAPLVDFFSVGTNDLTQYTLACDRQNPDVEQFVDTHHEAVLRLIEMSAENAHGNGIPIGICGELAADTTLTETFLRMGIDELSVSPRLVLKVRDAVRKLDLSGRSAENGNPG